MRTVTLTPTDNVITGKYVHGEEAAFMCKGEDESFSVTLPDAESNETPLIIKAHEDNAENIVTLSCIGSQTINGAASKTLRRKESVRVISDGSKYHIV